MFQSYCDSQAHIVGSLDNVVDPIGLALVAELVEDLEPIAEDRLEADIEVCIVQHRLHLMANLLYYKRKFN